MLSSLLRPRKKRRNSQRSPFSSISGRGDTSPEGVRRALLHERRHPAADFDGDHHDVYDEDDEDGDEGENEEDHDVDEEDDEDGAAEDTPLLPIFSAVHLDALPIYSLTHTLRILVVTRCETTLSWDQLRSPQVSQFLVKPILQAIQSSHFSKATLYALMANCLQFGKEIQSNPGNSGTTKTRSMVCELLAIKLLKEYTVRELIDALSYDFFPLQGQGPPGTSSTLARPNWDFNQRGKPPPRVARISCLEIAIRAQAKRFLAHPLVVQHLEAIWAGTIVFHSAADNMHRAPVKMTPNQLRGYGTNNQGQVSLDASPSKLHPAKQRQHQDPVPITFRRSVTLYNPRDASLFKLSRLRVPRYRQFLSTLSFAILLALFLAVLIRKSVEITSLEVVFWFWSAGFMLDEIVGFNEQGFSLYLMSFWNTFDVGILIILIIHYCLRLYGVVMPSARKHTMANLAYDVLAVNATLLFPRLFSILDHYRYFSQLLIAFRMMAADLVAVFILIIIACSGFLVAFCLSFGNYENDTPQSVLYALFQMLMGFTPAAWDRWSKYNLLGQFLLVVFLFICHFLIVTILITVLTNSFMAIVANANEEHQFLFAVNTISMVKSDALFSYVAPTNIFAWLLTPLRYCVPFRKFVKINRTVIKITHFPILFSICLYEKVILSSAVFDSTDLIDRPRGRSPGRGKRRNDKRTITGIRFFSPNANRMREPSVTTYHKDRALEELFRRPLRDDTIRGTQKSEERRLKTSVVNNWMQGIDPGHPSPSVEHDRDEVDRLEAKRPSIRRQFRSYHPNVRDFTEATRSVASDPEDFGPSASRSRPIFEQFRPDNVTPSQHNDVTQQTDADGDDELHTSDNEDEDEDRQTLTRKPSDDDDDDAPTPSARNEQPHSLGYFGRIDEKTKTHEPQAEPISSSYSSANRARFSSPPTRTVSRRHSPNRPPKTPRRHDRTVSTNTILFNPLKPSDSLEVGQTSSSTDNKTDINDFGKSPTKRRFPASGTQTPSQSVGRRTPKQTIAVPVSRTRPTMPDKSAFMSAPNLAGFLHSDRRGKGGRAIARTPSISMDIGSDIGDNKAVGGGFVGALPASFNTHLAYATGGMGRQSRHNDDDDAGGMFGRLLLARMNNLEEGFREVMREIKDMNMSSRRESSESRSHSASGKSRHHSRRHTAKNFSSSGAAGQERRKDSDKKTLSKKDKEDIAKKKLSGSPIQVSDFEYRQSQSQPEPDPQSQRRRIKEDRREAQESAWVDEDDLNFSSDIQGGSREEDDDGDGDDEQYDRPQTARRMKGGSV